VGRALVAYLLRRLLFAGLMLAFASVAVFGLVETLAAGGAPPVGRLAARYAVWVGETLSGDLGTSYRQRVPVGEIIGRNLWPTVLLMGSSLAVTGFLAVPLGIYSALRRSGPLDRMGRGLFFVGFSLPGFWLGAMLQLFLGVYLSSWAGTRIFYVSGMSSPGGGGVVDLLQHLALPVAALSLASVAQFYRFQRGAMIEALSEDYVRAARARGLSRRAVYLKHALRNALAPTVTLFALSLGTITGGAIVIETIFSWPGLGYLFIRSLALEDYEIVRALLMINAGFVIFFNLLADFAYGLLDPRVSAGE
jgi:peptide/nickel transport system permease protein